MVLKEAMSMLSRSSFSVMIENKTIEDVSQLVGVSQISLPTNLKNVIFQVKDTTSGTPWSGCNDVFSVFAFLSFLLALITLMQNAGNGRKKRSTGCRDQLDYKTNIKVQEGTMVLKILLIRRPHFVVDLHMFCCSPFILHLHEQHLFLQALCSTKLSDENL